MAEPSSEELLVLLEKLKFNLREKNSPFFDDDELFYLLEEADYDINRSTYNGLLRKAEDDSITLPLGLVVPNNQQYWLRLSRQYRTNKTGSIKRGDKQ